jgi:hemoglobin
MTATATGTTLYRRLGGYDTIAAFTDQWLGRVLADPPLAAYFRGMSNDTKGRARQLIVDFIASSFGGPTIYTGRNMQVLHEGLGISDLEYAALVQHAADTLTDLGVAAEEKDAVLAWFASLEGDIVEQR